MLSALHQTLGQTGAAALNQAKAIYGLGGVGKTQTAIEYAYRYFYDQPAYEWVFWVKAETDLNLATDLGKLADVLQLSGEPDRKLEEKVAQVLHWLETNNGWLLIFDNADDPDLVKPYRPRNPQGRILLTSWAQRFVPLGIAQPLEIRDMTPDEAREFLLKRIERQVQAITEIDAVDELTEELGYLPLALEQAGAYLCETQALSVEEYLQVYRQQRLELLEEGKPDPKAYPESVATTWAINFQAVERTTPAAVELLWLSAFLSPDDIPYELLTLGAEHLGEPLRQALAEAANNPLVLSRLLTALTCYSLIRIEPEKRYSLHRMVQEVLRDGMDQETRQQWLGRTVEALNQVFPYVEFENWQQCDRLVTHVQSLDHHLEQIPYDSVSSGRLLNAAGYYLHEQGRL